MPGTQVAAFGAFSEYDSWGALRAQAVFRDAQAIGMADDTEFSDLSAIRGLPSRVVLNLFMKAEKP